MPRAIPTQIGRFHVVRRLGAGGMAVVYLAKDPALGRTLAIKVLPEVNAELSQRFTREARSIAQLTHPNIVTVYDFGEDDGQPFIAMEYVEGETLGDFIRRGISDDIGLKLQIAIQLTAGIGYAHRMGVIHRDIKPGNVMLTADKVVKILDFGLARMTTEAAAQVSLELTRPGTIMGTPHYMSPEQVEGKTADERSDIFAIGVVIYELLAHQKAHPGDSAHAVLNRIVTTDPSPLRELCPDLDPELERVVHRAVQRPPESRYQSLAEMTRDLESIRTRFASGGSRAGRVPAATRTGSISREPSPRYGFDLSEIARRRTAQIDQHMNAAVAALSEGRFDTAIHECELVAALDPEHAHMLEVLTEAHKGIVTKQVTAWLSDAESHLEKGEFSQAQLLIEQSLQLSPDSSDAQRLKEVVVERRREAERQRRLKIALERANTLLRREAFEAVIGATSEVEEIDPDNAEAAAIRHHALAGLEEKRQHARELETRALVARALREAERGDFARAYALLRGTDPSQPHVDPADPLVAQTIREVERQELAAGMSSATVIIPAKADSDRTALSTPPVLPSASAPAFELESTAASAGSKPPARGIGRESMLAAVAVFILLSAGAAWWAYARRGPISVERAEVPAGDVTPIEHRLSVNAVPWATVRLTPTGPTTGESRSFTTPFSVSIPEGEYQLEFSHPTFGSTNRRLVVGAGKVETLQVTMPGADVERIVNEVLGEPQR